MTTAAHVLHEIIRLAFARGAVRITRFFQCHATGRTELVADMPLEDLERNINAGPQVLRIFYPGGRKECLHFDGREGAQAIRGVRGAQDLVRDVALALAFPVPEFEP